MYNRYVPQPDGSYRRNRMEDPRQAPQQTPRRTEPQRKPDPPCAPPPPPPKSPEPCKASGKHQEQPVTGFLQQLLPKDFDTADLIIVLLLLLLAGDCDEDRNTALLTLVLYLFL